MRRTLIPIVLVLLLQACQTAPSGTVAALPEGACFTLPQGRLAADTLAEDVECTALHTHELLARITIIGAGSATAQRDQANLACRDIVANTTGGRALPSGTSLIVVLPRGGPTRGAQDALCIIEHSTARRGRI